MFKYKLDAQSLFKNITHYMCLNINNIRNSLLSTSALSKLNCIQMNIHVGLIRLYMLNYRLDFSLNFYVVITNWYIMRLVCTHIC